MTLVKWMAAALLAFAGGAAAQVLPFPPAAQVKLAVDALSGKAYALDEANDRVQVYDRTGSLVKSIGVGPRPQYIAVDAATRRAYVNNAGDASLTVVDLSTDTNLTPTPRPLGSVGPITVNPATGVVYVVRFTSPATDEVTFYQPAADTWYTIATESWQPISMAVDPVRERIYVAHYAGDLRIISGRYDESDDFPSTTGIPMWSRLFAVVANPVTDKAYVIVDDPRGAIAVVDGATSQASFPAIASGHGLSPKGLAINTATNKVYAAFADEVVVIDGATQGLAYVPASTGSGPVGLAVDVALNRVYVAADNGVLTILDGEANTPTTQAIPAGPTTIGVNPASHQVFLFNGDALTVLPMAGAPRASPLVTAIAPLPGNASGTSATFTFDVTGTYSTGLPARAVYWQLDGVDGAWQRASGTGPWTASVSGMVAGSHTIHAFATDGQDSPLATGPQSVPVIGTVASYAFGVSVPQPAITLSPTALDFGGQSMGTPSPPLTVSVRNSGSASLTVSGMAIGGSQAGQYAQSNDCGTLAANATCTVTVRFQPAVDPGAALNASIPAAATLSIASDAPGSPHAVPLAGAGEKSLVTHFYRSILRRAPDAQGRDFWAGEAQRLKDLGANVNEAWFAMAAGFFALPEYASFGRDDAAFMADLYATFFNRAPDPGGVAFWSDQLAQGLPREVALAGFMFSPEFAAFTQGIFGDTAARSEVDLVGDFYRGLLARLPDSTGFAFWVGRFRAAQRDGDAAVRAEADAISGSFAAGGEYASRARTNAQYVGDLYNAFLRRGGELQGVRFWIDRLDSGTATREELRASFRDSGEFNGRVQAVVGAGCAR